MPTSPRRSTSAGQPEHDDADESAPAQGTQREGAAWWEGLALALALGLTRVRRRRGIVAGVCSAWLGAGIDDGLIGAVVGVGVGGGRHEPIVVTHP